MNQQEIEAIALKESGLKKGFDREEEEHYQSEKVKIYDLTVRLLSGTPRITVGRGNCLNDVPVLLESSLPDIRGRMEDAFAKGDYEALAEQSQRLTRVAKDLDDMADELKNHNKK